MQGHLAPEHALTEQPADSVLINVMWTLRGRPEHGGLDFLATFYANSPERPGRQLHEHDPAWLVHLLSATGTAAQADQGRIFTDGLDDALADRVELPPLGLGALSLAPHGVPEAELPASVTVYPCPVGYPDGKVIVADLERVANDPESLVDDLLTVGNLLEQAAVR